MRLFPWPHVGGFASLLLIFSLASHASSHNSHPPLMTPICLSLPHLLAHFSMINSLPSWAHSFIGHGILGSFDHDPVSSVWTCARPFICVRAAASIGRLFQRFLTAVVERHIATLKDNSLLSRRGSLSRLWNLKCHLESWCL